MADKNRDWLEDIQKLPGWITGLFAFVTTVIGFIKLWPGDTGLVTGVLLAIGIGGGWVGCSKKVWGALQTTIVIWGGLVAT